MFFYVILAGYHSLQNICLYRKLVLPWAYFGALKKMENLYENFKIFV